MKIILDFIADFVSAVVISILIGVGFTFFMFGYIVLDICFISSCGFIALALVMWLTAIWFVRRLV